MQRGRSRKGAWIEISVRAEFNNDPRVAPARERGLKFGSAAGAFAGGVVAPARERGLKFSQKTGVAFFFRRSRKGAWIEIKIC